MANFLNLLIPQTVFSKTVTNCVPAAIELHLLIVDSNVAQV